MWTGETVSQKDTDIDSALYVNSSFTRPVFNMFDFQMPSIAESEGIYNRMYLIKTLDPRRPVLHTFPDKRLCICRFITPSVSSRTPRCCLLKPSRVRGHVSVWSGPPRQRIPAKTDFKPNIFNFVCVWYSYMTCKGGVRWASSCDKLSPIGPLVLKEHRLLIRN